MFEKILGPDNAITKFLDSFSFTEMFDAAIDAVSSFLKNLPENLSKIGTAIAESLSRAVDSVSETASNFGKWVMESLSGLWESTKETVTGIGKTIGQAFSDGVLWIKKSLWQLKIV